MPRLNLIRGSVARSFCVGFLLAALSVAGEEPGTPSGEKAVQVASAWFTSLMRGDTAVTTSLSDVPFDWDRKEVVESLAELEELYERVAEDRGNRDVMPSEIEVVDEDSEIASHCAEETVVVLLMIEGEGVAVCVRPGSAYRVVGFSD